MGASRIDRPEAALSFVETRLTAALEQLQCSDGDENPFNSTSELIQWLDDMKAQNHILQKRTDLRSLADWNVDGRGYLVHRAGKFFKIVGMEVTSSSREVNTWSQPILDNVGTGIIGLLCRQMNDATYFLMQAKAEPGNRSIVQIGPTVQFTQNNYTDNDGLEKPFLFDEFDHPRLLTPFRETRQSEEGARFYREEHVHKILLLPDAVPLAPPPEYRWFSYSQIRFFLYLGETVNSCARSIFACLL